MVPKSVRSVIARRLHNQLLTGPPKARAQAVVGHLCAVQAQDYGPAKWAIASRTRSATDRTLEAAFAKGRILRTHVMRPTWHVVLPDDIGWLLELTGPRIEKMAASSRKRLGLKERELTKSMEVLADALSGGNELTRKEIRELFRSERIDLRENRLSHLLMHAELCSLICSGAPRGKQQTHALLSERAPEAKTMERDDALRTLVLRYLRAHGPATEKDLRWWASLTAADVRRGLDLARDELSVEEVNGLRLWSLPSDEVDLETPVAHLLQTYDEYIVGYTESRSLIALPGVEIWSRPSSGVLIMDGLHAGNWKRTGSEEEVGVELVARRKLTKREVGAVEAEAERFAGFQGLSECRIELSKDY